MEEDIKRLEELIHHFKDVDERTLYNQELKNRCKRNYIALEHLLKAYKEKDKDNNDLRRLYRRTAIKLRENGKEELADYFLAQINEVPTFVVDDDIDYYTEYYKLKEVYKELEEIEKERKERIGHLETKLFNLRREVKLLKSHRLREYMMDNYIEKSLVEEKIEELNTEEKELQDSITEEEREEYSDANISFELMDVEIRRSVLQELLEKRK